MALPDPPARGRHPLIAELVKPFHPAACWTALVFFWPSVHPTMLPRTWLIQGVITGISIALGIAVGNLGVFLAGFVLRAMKRDAPVILPGPRRLVFAVVAAVVVVIGLVFWVVWQNDQRDLVGMDHISIIVLPGVVLVAGLVAAFLVLLGRLVGHPVRLLDRSLSRHMPRGVAFVASAVIVVVVVVIGSRDLVLDPLVDRINSSFAATDEGTPPGIEQPTSSQRSGGPGSLVAWDTLGYEGRHFTGGGPTTLELEDFAGPGAQVEEPIRVYVGLDSADTLAAQTQLALEELDRTGAFDREVLVVATVTGTGWVNPTMAAAVEYMYDGNTAIVATQYSFLPSWISFLVDQDKAEANGEALIDAVSDRWQQMPEASRPMLVALGESLGSLGSEAAFASDDIHASLAEIAQKVDVALWAGPTFVNPIWKQVVASRDEGAPTWHPTHGDGEQIVIIGNPDEPPAEGRLRPEPLVVYQTHPSDPVTWVSVDALWSRPQWMRSPLGYDVPSNLFWFPGVTMVQTVFDLMAGFSAPPGHGHDYRPSIPDGWVLAAAPPGWTAADTDRLDAVLPSDG